MTQKKLSLQKLMLSLLTTLILVTNQTTQAADLAKRLQAGEPAKFQGTLIPDWQWKKLNEDLVEKDLLKAQIAEIKPAEVHKSALEVFLFGFIAGSSAVLLIEKFGR